MRRNNLKISGSFLWLLYWVLIHSSMGAASDLIIDAAKQGNISEVKRLVTQGTDIQFSDEFMMTPLHHAAYRARYDVVAYLIKIGANVNARNKAQETPLHLCAQDFKSEQRVEVASLLINNKADVNATSKGGETPLHYAAYYGYSELIDLLIANGAKINTREIDIGATPFHKATPVSKWDVCRPGVLRQLARYGAEVNATISENGDSALHLAAFSGHVACVEVLLDLGANPKMKNKFGETPLDNAKAKGHTDVIKILEKSE